jgi:transcriptional regulator with XRE-family HTH domain
MSLAELGRVSRLSKGTLTQLEAGLANPTVDTLHALSRALGTTLGDLVSDPPTVGPQIVRAAEAPGWSSGRCSGTRSSRRTTSSSVPTASTGRRPTRPASSSTSS